MLQSIEEVGYEKKALRSYELNQGIVQGKNELLQSLVQSGLLTKDIEKFRIGLKILCFLYD